MKYRPEIDGIRAIAVVAVILYHAEFFFWGKTWFQGGYVGVDVFFVLSGYFITKLIFAEIDATGRFSAAYFYIRRIRRILPALLTVMAASAPLAYLYILPDDFVDFAKSGLASIAFSSNIYFYFTATEYGAAPALLKPFLHTWSLSVEEQFYILFPVVAILIHRTRINRQIAMGSLLLLSLIACIAVRAHDQQLAFFLPFTRAWELLAGSMLAIRELAQGPTKRTTIGNALSVLGFIMVGASVLLFSKSSAHPGFLTLIPVAGTCLMISFLDNSSPLGRTMSTKGLVWIGLLSYSLYLWHFPVFAFARINDIDFNNGEKIAAIAMTFALSVTTFLLIERPGRTNLHWPMVRISFIQTLAVSIAAVWTIYSSGFPARLDAVFPATAVALEESSEAEFSNFVGNPSDPKPVIFIIGDSHVTNWSVALNRHIDHERFDVVSVSYLNCEVSIEAQQIRATAMWPAYTKYCGPFETYVNEESLINRTVAVFLTSHRPFEYGVNLFRFDVLEWIGRRAPNPKIFVFGNFYQLDGIDLPSCLSLMFRTDRDASVCLENATYPPAEFRIEELPFYPASPSFRYVDLVDLYCSEGKNNCSVASDGVPFMLDWNHLTVTFIDRLIDKIIADNQSHLAQLGLDNFFRRASRD